MLAMHRARAARILKKRISPSVQFIYYLDDSCIDSWLSGEEDACTWTYHFDFGWIEDAHEEGCDALDHQFLSLVKARLVGPSSMILMSLSLISSRI